MLKTTEDIILSKTQAKFIGKVNEEKEFTSKTICNYAKKFRQN
ncbi:hypothetical protein [Psychroflexus sp. MBR-150]|jgi:hypothetical protein